MKRRQTKSAPSQQQGFSLIEVSVAIGIVSFSMLAILGLLPVGLNTVHDSLVQGATAGIAQQIQADLQQIAFNSANAFNIQSISSSSYYYSDDGIPANATDAYYKASFTVNNPTFGENNSVFNTTNAQNVIVTLLYPIRAPAAGQKSCVFSLLIAKQTSD
ncbi:MAG: Verru_Chthon cassette protein B [Chthoniobacteraceae bacterium]